MRTRIQLIFFVFIVVISRNVKHTNANVLFRFALDFHVKSDDSTENEDIINKTLIFENNHVTVKNNLNTDESIEELTGRRNDLTLVTATTDPPTSISDFWLQDKNFTATADPKLKEIVEKLRKLNEEISPVVGRSDFISSKVKLITRYLNILNASTAEALNSDTTIADNKFEYLQKFIKLVNKLKEPPSGVNSGERTIDYMVMKLALEKHQITTLQAEVEDHVTAAVLAWQQYVKSKIVEVTV